MCVCVQCVLCAAEHGHNWRLNWQLCASSCHILWHVSSCCCQAVAADKATMQQERVAVLIRTVSVAKLSLSLACALSSRTPSHSPSLSVLRSTCASLSLSTLTSLICLADVTYTRVCRMLHKFLWMESWKHRANNKNNQKNKSNQSRKLKQRQNAKTMRVLYLPEY